MIFKFNSTTILLWLCILFTNKHYAHNNDNQLHALGTNIRVLLAQAPAKKRTEWTITTEHGVIVNELNSGKQWPWGPTLRITITDHNYYLINGKKQIPKGPLRIESQDFRTNILCTEGRTYQGSLLIIPHEKSTLLINSIDLDHYIVSVLRTESWPGWPLEVNKAFAIASRSYATAKILEAREKSLPYHIKNTNAHQTYHGYHTLGQLKKAVAETAGIILTYDKKPIVAMFDCCCGGIIPANMEDVHFAKAPYLKRTQACTYCTSCAIYTWKISFTKKELEARLKQTFKHIRRLDRLEITKTDPAGIVKEITIHHRGKPITVDGRKFYALFKETKSFCFTIENNQQTIIINGKGYGHHLGLCQWGSREMVRKGFNYTQILDFFYPGATFMKVRTREKELL
jgi:stage II sporulation protein D